MPIHSETATSTNKQEGKLLKLRNELVLIISNLQSSYKVKYCNDNGF